MRTSELIGPALNWAVVKASEQNADYWFKKYASEDRRCMCESPSTDWSEGGPIIEREEIGIKRNAPCSTDREWEASPSITAKGAGSKWGYGPTPLVAAMRCYVASRLGDEVEIPEELK